MELSRGGKRVQVESMAVEPLPEGAVEERNPTNLEQVGAVIKRALKTSGTRLKKAAVAVPTSGVITRTIPMPAEYGDDEIDASIQIEAAQYIPFPLEEIYLDFQVQGPSKAAANSQDVMIVATRRENVDLRQEALEEAGLQSILVDVEAYALENLFSQVSRFLFFSDTDDEATIASRISGIRTAVIDVGAAVTTLYIFQGESVVFTRELSVGCDQLTQTIADTYNLPKDRAELAKRSGELSEDYPSTVLEPFRQRVAEQIGSGLQFFFSSSNHNSVDSILLLGGGGMVAGLDKVIGRQLEIPTVVANPFENMASAKRVNRRSLLRDAPLFSVAYGLALRSMDQ